MNPTKDSACVPATPSPAGELAQEERESVYDFNWDELKAEYAKRTGRS